MQATFMMAAQRKRVMAPSSIATAHVAEIDLNKIKRIKIDSKQKESENLLLAIDNKKKKVALEMLKHPDQYNLGIVNNNNITPLFLAITREIEDVALEIVKHPNKCKLDHVRNEITTLMQTTFYGMEKVALKILEHPKKCKLDHIHKYSKHTALMYAIGFKMEN